MCTKYLYQQMKALNTRLDHYKAVLTTCYIYMSHAGTETEY